MSDGAPLTDRVAEIWQKFRPAILARVSVLEDAAFALVSGGLDAERRQIAAREAHKLAGSVGTFGYAAASRHARTIENLLEGDEPLVEADVLNLSDLVLELRRELERSPSAPVPPVAATPESQGRNTLLLISGDDDLGSRIEMEAAGRGFEIFRAANAADAYEMLTRRAYAAILLDMLVPSVDGGPLAVLEQVVRLSGEAPVLALASEDTFAHRVEVMRHGARAFVHQPITAVRIVGAVEEALLRGSAVGARVLLLDDDPQVLELVNALLSSRGMEAHPVQDASTFWVELGRVRPDLVILDLEMPGLNGLEICRAIRNDPKWGSIPVLFLTGHTEIESVRAVFAAGADDYVSKPVVGPELIMRIENRIERSRFRGVAGATAGPGGVKGREAAREDIARVIALAARCDRDATVAKVAVDGVEALKQSLGAAAGESALARAGVLLQSSLAPGDAVGWWGGSEFAVAYFDSDVDVVTQRLDGLLDVLRRETVTTEHGQTTVTFSAGVAGLGRDGQDLSELLSAAEHALAAARQITDGSIVAQGRESTQMRTELVDVVVVEDDSVIAELVRHALEMHGYTVRVIGDGAEATDLLAGPAPKVRGKVVLLDVDLPGRDGLAVLREMAAAGVLERSSVVMLTARSTEREVLAAMRTGAVDHVAKPFSVAILLARIRNLLERQ